MLPDIYYEIVTFVIGIAVGSFLNVCICRLPEQGDIVREPSHCMSCGHRLAWYDNIPLVSWTLLRGRCRYCGAAISLQYPLVELANGVLWLVTVMLLGADISAYIYCAVISAMLVLSIIDIRTFEIPFGINVFIFICGLAEVAADGIAAYSASEPLKGVLINHIGGMLIVSIPLWLLLVASRGRAIGGGDIKLFFAAGLVLGLGRTLIAFILACAFASVIHVARMKLAGADAKLAMGPYISAGICASLWFGDTIAAWYMSLLVP